MATILQDAGSFTILAPSEAAIQQFPMIIEDAGRTCYQSNLGRDIHLHTGEAFVRRLIKSGHESVLEHCGITVRFENCSRGFTHELVRHRVGIAFSQESTRYVDESDLHFVLPPGKDLEQEYEMEPDSAFVRTLPQMVDHLEKMYRILLKAGWKPEDARQFLPIGTTSEIVVTANLREWRHIFSLRTAPAAHWEIRSVMKNVLDKFNELLPCVFEDIKGPR